MQNGLDNINVLLEQEDMIYAFHITIYNPIFFIKKLTHVVTFSSKLQIIG